MPGKIACPNCRTEFDTCESLWVQLSHQIRTELEFEFHDGRAAIYKARRDLNEQQELLEAQQQSMDQKIQEAVDNELKRATEEVQQKVSKAFELETKVRDQQIIYLRNKLMASQKKVWDLLRKIDHSENQNDDLDHTVARQLELEREKVRQQTLKQFAVEQEQRDAEQQRLVDELRWQITELKRNADLALSELKSVDQEIAFEEMLLSAFPMDSIEPMTVGTSGAGTIQRVHCPSGADCGSILWNSKRTSGLKSSWFKSLNLDRQKADASFAVVVTDSLPAGVESFAMIENAWISSWKWAKSLAAALRNELIEISRSDLTEERKADISDSTFDQFNGTEFEKRITESVKRV